MAERRSAEEYYRDTKPRIEAALAHAVCVAISEKDTDPISRVAHLLQHQRTDPPETGINHQWAVDEALKLYEESKKNLGKDGLSQAEIERVQSWKFQQWLDSLRLSSILLQPLLQPLREKERSPGAELPFVHAIGQLQDWTDLFDILTSHDAFATIAKVMWDSARSLFEASVPKPSPTTTQSSCKFADVQLSLGAPSMFFKGLDDFIGPPNPNVREAMTHEHTTHNDSTFEFVAHNYQTKTTSRREWFFVVEPKEGLKKTDLSEWPKEKKPPSSDLLDGCEEAGTSSRRPGPRTPKELTSFEANLNIKNGLLRDLGEEPVTWDELIGARLYTGPMFQKYNGVLRCIGNVRMKQSGHVLTESEIEIKLREDNEAETKGNVYTTTLHVINSACIKLGKLTSAAKVYRGISGRLLPDEMDVANKYNVRGGVEFGFMSATLDRRVAMGYAKGTGERPALLFEMQMGMIDRGADLSWLSEYPHEREILFAPLSALEVLKQHVHGHVRVIDVRLSVNLQALTIEQVISKMQRSHLQLVDLLQDNMRFAGVPARLLAPLQQLRLKASHQDPSRFNEAEYYRTATNAALDSQNRIFEMIMHKDVWAKDGTADTGDEAGTPADQAEEMRRTAMLCARVGHHEKAADLLIMRVRLAEEAHGARTQQPSGARPICCGLVPSRLLAAKGPATVREAWEAIAHSLIMEDGLSAPWPGTLVALVKRSKLPDGDAGFIDTIKELVRKSQAERLPLFDIQSEVLALLVDEQIWEHARVRRVRDKSTTQIEPSEKGTKSLQDGYDVVSWRERPVVKENLLTPSVSGPAALLRHAAEKGEVELVGALLEAGVSVYQSDALANTALILAAKEGHADVCRKLKDAGASEHLRNASRENAYDLANHHGHTKVLRVFNPYSSDDDVGDQMDKFKAALAGGTLTRTFELNNRVTMLMLACRHGLLQPVQDLLEANANVLAQTKTGCTALMMAAEEGGAGHVEVVNMLLNRADGKESIEYQMQSGKKTAIMLAATNGHMRVVELLAEAGADIHVRNQKLKNGKEKDGRTVLHLTCMHGHTDVAEFLLKRGADINAVNANLDTPLMLAARYGHLKVVQLLLSRKCSFADETVKSSWSSIHRACGAGHVEVAQALLEAHPEFVNHIEPEKRLTPLMAAVGANFSEAAVILMDKGADVGMVDEKGRSAVFIAAKAGQEKSLRVLLTRKEVDVNQADLKKETPLIAACKNGHESTARLLLNAKAVFEEEEDQAGRPSNPLMIAARAGHEPIVRMLLNNGAKKRKQEATQAAENALVAEACGAGSAQPRASVEPFTAHEPSSPRLSGGLDSPLDRFKKVIQVFKKGAGGAAPAQPTAWLDLSTAAEPSSPSRQLEQARSSSIGGGDGPLDRFKKIIRLLEAKEDVAEETEPAPDTRPPAPLAIANGIQNDRAAIHREFEAALLSLTKFKPELLEVAPPRPSEKDLQANATGSGGLRLIHGIVVQRGPWHSIWIRVGCVDKVPWSALSNTLKACAERAIQQQHEAVNRGTVPSTIWLGITETSLQCVDFVWLKRAGFALHHYRKSGHLQSIDEAEAAVQPANAGPSLEPTEFLYFWRPSANYKLAGAVPPIASSVDIAAGVLLSHDGARVLVVRGRDRWTAAGAVAEGGEATLQALERVARKDLGVDIDFDSSPVYYVGGCQQSAGRDSRVNNNLSAFVVRLKEGGALGQDIQGVFQAAWFDWHALLQQWRAAGSMGQPSSGYVELEVAKAAPRRAAACKHSVDIDLLQWLDAYQCSRGMLCEVAPKGCRRIVRIGGPANAEDRV